jgi:hypothetical protein
MFIVFSNNFNAFLYIIWIHGMETKQYGIKILVVTYGIHTYHEHLTILDHYNSLVHGLFLLKLKTIL